MARLSPTDLDYLKTMDPRLHRVVKQVIDSVNNVADQTNASAVGMKAPPTPHAALSVKGGGGILDVAITDNSSQERGKTHFVEYADNASFTNSHVVSLGPSKNWRRAIGTGTFHVKSYAAYPTSAPSESVFHPPVSTTGPEPAMQASQGSGTGGGGFGNVPRT